MRTPSLPMCRLYHLSSFGRPSMTTALMPSTASCRATLPPELHSLMVPVSGLLQPTESRPALEAMVPVSSPGASTSLLLGPSGWQVGGTSAATIVEVRARPPKPSQALGAGSTVLLRSDI